MKGIVKRSFVAAVNGSQVLYQEEELVEILDPSWVTGSLVEPIQASPNAGAPERTVTAPAEQATRPPQRPAAPPPAAKRKK